MHSIPSLLAVLAFLIAGAPAHAAPSGAEAAADSVWRAVLAEDEEALRAAEEFVALLRAGNLKALAGRLEHGRLRLDWPRGGVPDGLYGPGQARSILADWLAPLKGRELRVWPERVLAEDRRLVLTLRWSPRSPEDLLPARQLVCELGLDGSDWRFLGAVSP